MRNAAFPVLLALTAGCGRPGAPVPPAGTPAPGNSLRPVERFVRANAELGIAFRHVHGGWGERYFPETMGAGGGWLDYDEDGWLDLYLVQSGPMPGKPDPTPLADRLYRNEFGKHFVDQTAAAGTGDTSYGMGVCFGDIDNDGLVDIYVTNFGPDRLWKNRGDGTFVDATETAGLGAPEWSTSCSFADYDRDGWLDLYVATYVDFTIATHVPCGHPGLRQYCHPDTYGGVPDRLYHNNGHGGFSDVSVESGIHRTRRDHDKGLGVIWFDFDDDGDLDVFVANDSTPNFLFRNDGNGRFTEVATTVGVAYGDTGATRAGMGVDAGDIDGDGRLDLIVTNLDFEPNSLYHNLGRDMFEESSEAAGIAAPSLAQVGFGTNFFDFDNDGDLDLYVANGHVLDQIEREKPTSHYAQSAQLYENDGRGRFRDVSSLSGAFFATRWVGRGAAFGDIDCDGDIDILQTNNNQAAVVLRNESGARTPSETHHWLTLRLASRHGGRDAIGARVRLSACGKSQVREVRSGSSYLSEGDTRLHFGLGSCTTIDGIEVRWPEGQLESVSPSRVVLDAFTRLDEPAGSGATSASSAASPTSPR